MGYGESFGLSRFVGLPAGDVHEVPLGPNSRELCWRWWLQSSVRSVIEHLLGDGYVRNPPAAADLNSAAALGMRGEVRLRACQRRARR